MKKLNRVLYSNKFIAFLMLVIQIAVFVAMFIWITDYSQIIMGFSTLITIVLIIWETNRTEEPTFKMTWITLLAIIPIFGALFYIYTRGQSIARSINLNYQKAHDINKKYLKQDNELINELEDIDTQEASFAKYLDAYGGSPAFSDTAVQYFPLGEKYFDAMKRELLKAEKFIFMEFFIINPADRMWKDILDILRRKVKEGVEVRVMYDAMGCVMMPRGYDATLHKYGIKTRVFSPIVPLLSTHQNNRDHRKILVIDGVTAFSGGVNIADEYINEKERFGHWKDTGFLLYGKAVAGFTAMFLEMWNVTDANIEDGGKYITPAGEITPSEANGYVIPFGDSPLDDVYIGKRAYIHNLNSASDFVHIMTPYLVIDNEMYESMKYAAQRGVDVKIIMPGIPDKKYAFYLARTYYKELLEAGVKIYEYTPGFVHAKVSVSDGSRAIVGTINHDYRSLYLHYECAAYMFRTPAIIDIEGDFQETLEKSEEITLEKIKHFNIFTRLEGKIIRLVAPLL